MEFLADMHPAVIHFPIVCFLLYALAETVGVLTQKDLVSHAAYTLLMLGMISSVVAVLTGNQAEAFADRNWLGSEAFPHDLIESHELFATLTIWFFILVGALRTFLLIKKKFYGRIKYIFIIFGIIGAFLIWRTGELGGHLVYKHGVGTDLTIDNENGKN